MSILKSKHSGWTWEGRRTPFGGGKGGGAPPPPDYRGAAIETAKGDLEAARIATGANRVNQITPYGSLVYSQQGRFDPRAYEQAYQSYQKSLSEGLPEGYSFTDTTGGPRTAVMPQEGYTWAYGPTGDRIQVRKDVANLKAPRPEDFLTAPATQDEGWTVRQFLSPEQQQLLDYQNKTSIGLGELTGTGLDYVKGMLQDPFTTKNLPSLGFNAGETYQDAYMRRLQPQIQQSRDRLNQDLANRGIDIGSEAYQRAMFQQAQRENDLLLGATTQGFGTGLSARQQGFTEAAYQRNEPLNTLNAVRTGAQVTNPSFVSVPQQATTKGADLLGAATAEGNYNTASANAQAAQNAGMTSGLFSLASTGVMAF
jgi:hypothetical protein